MITINVRKRLDAFSLDAAFTASPDGITAIFGRSGAGKSSIINGIAGLLPLDSGIIQIGDRTLFNHDTGINVPIHRRGIGYVFQEGRLFPHMTVRNNLLYGQRFLPDAAGPLALEEIVELLGIGHLLNRRPGRLSGGEKQRVALGRALLAGPKLLLLDEPLSSLDGGLQAEILPLIERVRDGLKIPMIYVSHSLEEVIRLADHMVVVEDGRVAAEGPVLELMSRLDLSTLTDLPDGGAVIDTVYDAYDSEFDLGELSFAGGTIRIAGLKSTPGLKLRAHIRARDVSIMLSKPADTSVLNVFDGIVREIRDTGGPQLDLLLDVGAPLIARITRKSYHHLGLAPGKQVYALVKSVAIDRRSLAVND